MWKVDPIAYLSTKYPTIPVEEYFEIIADGGVTTNDILDFCQRYRIKCIAYDVDKNIIGQYHINNPKRKPLIYIAHNNHIYPVENKLLKKAKKGLRRSYY